MDSLIRSRWRPESAGLVQYNTGRTEEKKQKRKRKKKEKEISIFHTELSGSLSHTGAHRLHGSAARLERIHSPPPPFRLKGNVGWVTESTITGDFFWEEPWPGRICILYAEATALHDQRGWNNHRFLDYPPKNCAHYIPVDSVVFNHRRDSKRTREMVECLRNVIFFFFYPVYSNLHSEGENTKWR